MQCVATVVCLAPMEIGIVAPAARRHAETHNGANVGVHRRGCAVSRACPEVCPQKQGIASLRSRKFWLLPPLRPTQWPTQCGTPLPDLVACLRKASS